MPDLKDLTAEIIRFRDEREQTKFHPPWNLASAAKAIAGDVLLVLAPLRID